MAIGLRWESVRYPTDLDGFLPVSSLFIAAGGGGLGGFHSQQPAASS